MSTLIFLKKLGIKGFCRGSYHLTFTLYCQITPLNFVNFSLFTILFVVHLFIYYFLQMKMVVSVPVHQAHQEVNVLFVA